MRWLKESNEEAEGDECCGWRRRLRRINKTLNATFSEVSLVFKLKFHSSTITILQYITFPSIRTIIINRTFMELSTIVEIIEAYQPVSEPSHLSNLQQQKLLKHTSQIMKMMEDNKQSTIVEIIEAYQPVEDCQNNLIHLQQQKLLKHTSLRHPQWGVDVIYNSRNY